MATMANYRIGRVALHLMCILRGGDPECTWPG